MLASLAASTHQRAAGTALKHEVRRQAAASVAAGAATGAKQHQQASGRLGGDRRRRPTEPAVQVQLHRLQPSMLLKGERLCVAPPYIACLQTSGWPCPNALFRHRMRSCRQPHRLLFMQRSFFVSLCSGAWRGAGACTRGAGSSRGGVLCGAAMRLAGAALEQMRASLTAHVEVASSRNSLPH